LPEEWVATPRLAAVSERLNTALVAPRALKTPPFWKFSHLKDSRAPVRASSVLLVSTGVRATLPAMRSRASSMSCQLSAAAALDGFGLDMGRRAWAAIGMRSSAAARKRG